MSTQPNPGRPNRLLHQQQLPGTLDLAGNMTLLLRGQPSDAAGKDLPGLGSVAAEQFHIDETKVHRGSAVLFCFCAFRHGAHESAQSHSHFKLSFWKNCRFLNFRAKRLAWKGRILLIMP